MSRIWIYLQILDILCKIDKPHHTKFEAIVDVDRFQAVVALTGKRRLVCKMIRDICGRVACTLYESDTIISRSITAPLHFKTETVLFRRSCPAKFHSLSNLLCIEALQCY